MYYVSKVKSTYMKYNDLLTPMDSSQLYDVFQLTRTCGLNNNTSFEEWKILFKWGVIDNPYRKGQVPGHIIIKNNRIVASIAYWYVPFKFGTWVGVVPNIGDMSIHPAHRGILGVFFIKKIFDYQGFDIAITTHGSKAGEMLWRRFGSVSCPQTNKSFRGYLSFKKSIDRTMEKKGHLLGLLSKKGMNSFFVPWTYLKNYNCRDIKCPKPFCTVIYPFKLNSESYKDVNLLCDKAQSIINTGIIRNATYLSWRYFNHPLAHQYYALAIKNNDDELMGVAILQLLPGSCDVRISEFIYNPEIDISKRELILASIMVAKEIGGITIITRLICDELMKNWKDIRMTERSKPYDQFLIFTKPQIKRPDYIKCLYSFGDYKIF